MAVGEIEQGTDKRARKPRQLSAEEALVAEAEVGHTVSVQPVSRFPEINKSKLMDNILASGLNLCLSKTAYDSVVGLIDNKKVEANEIFLLLEKMLKSSPRLKSIFRHQWTPDFFVRSLLRNEGTSIEMYEDPTLKNKAGENALVVVFGHRKGKVNGTDVDALVGRGGFSYIRMALVEDREDQYFVMKSPQEATPFALKNDQNESGFQHSLEGQGVPELTSIREIRDHTGKLTEIGILMPHYEGLTLKEIGALPSPEFANRALLGPSFALARLEQLGLSHLDVSPNNILLALQQNQAKLLDIGAGQDRYLDANLPDGQIRGTPGYIAPEMLKGGSKEGTSKSDVFSLACVLYFARTGNELFGEIFKDKKALKKTLTDPATIHKMLEAQTAAIEDLHRKGEHEFADALSHMLAHDPDSRWSMKEAHEWLVEDTYGPGHKPTENELYDLPGKGMGKIGKDQAYPPKSRLWHETHKGLHTRVANQKHWEAEVQRRQDVQEQLRTLEQNDAYRRVMMIRAIIVGGFAFALLCIGGVWYLTRTDNPTDNDPGEKDKKGEVKKEDTPKTDQAKGQKDKGVSPVSVMKMMPEVINQLGKNITLVPGPNGRLGTQYRVVTKDNAGKETTEFVSVPPGEGVYFGDHAQNDGTQLPHGRWYRLKADQAQKLLGKNTNDREIVEFFFTDNQKRHRVYTCFKGNTDAVDDDETIYPIDPKLGAIPFTKDLYKNRKTLYAGRGGSDPFRQAWGQGGINPVVTGPLYYGPTTDHLPLRQTKPVKSGTDDAHVRDIYQKLAKRHSDEVKVKTPEKKGQPKQTGMREPPINPALEAFSDQLRDLTIESTHPWRKMQQNVRSQIGSQLVMSN